MKKSFADILKEDEAEIRRRMALKVPEWSDTSGLTFPTRLSTEQCSSSATARYKASVAAAAAASRGIGSPVIADLTGGLGVDSWAFRKAGFAVSYNEMNQALAQAVGANFKALGADSIVVSSVEVTPENVGAMLDERKPDIVYIDPARRSASGSKVFRIEECTPNVLGMKDIILQKAGILMLKLSPMADITQVVRELDSGETPVGAVTQVHVVGAAGECKELLVVMESGVKAGEPMIIVASDDADMSFRPSEESAAVPDMSVTPAAGMLLFEPGSALMKSGAFNLISSRFGVQKLGRQAHLYCRSSAIPELSDFGKWFIIREILPLGKASFRELSSRSLRAEVTARGLHLTSDELRRRLGVNASSADGRAHIFGAATSSSGELIIITDRC